MLPSITTTPNSRNVFPTYTQLLNTNSLRLTFHYTTVASSLVTKSKLFINLSTHQHIQTHTNTQYIYMYIYISYQSTASAPLNTFLCVLTLSPLSALTLLDTCIPPSAINISLTSAHIDPSAIALSNSYSLSLNLSFSISYINIYTYFSNACNSFCC